jgi:hypothetical protein
MDNDNNQIIFQPDAEANNAQQNTNKIKEPSNWTTGNEPMTSAQRDYLKTLMEIHGEPFDENLSKAQAAELIDAKKQNIGVSNVGDVQDNLFETLKDPDNWRTGDEPATGAQRSYLQTLAAEAGEQVDENVSKAEASKKIEALQQKTGRGKK